MKWAGIVCILSSFELFAVVMVGGGTYRLFGSASILGTGVGLLTFALFPLGTVLLIVGAWRSRKVKKKAKIGLLQEGETKKNPGLAILLSFFYCGLGQLYNGQILKGILYMFFYGLFWYAVIWSQTIPQESTKEPIVIIIDFWSSLYLFVPPIVFWVRGMTDANRTARRINVQLDYLKQKEDLTTKKTNLCVNCWLSGDCEREKEVIKKRGIITDCRGYSPKNK